MVLRSKFDVAPAGAGGDDASPRPTSSDKVAVRSSYCGEPRVTI